MASIERLQTKKIFVYSRLQSNKINYEIRITIAYIHARTPFSGFISRIHIINKILYDLSLQNISSYIDSVSTV